MKTLRTGAIVDATIINAPTSIKNSSGKRDPAMHQAKKGNQWYFGGSPKSLTLKARFRARFWHPFRVLKRQFGYRAVRYHGGDLLN